MVVLNWNGTADTERCLGSLRAADPRPATVVVVDNASRDEEVDRLRAWIAGAAKVGAWGWTECEEDDAPPDDERGDREPEEGDERGDRAVAEPWLVLQRLGSQRGFSGGNNAGIRTMLRTSRPTPTHLLLLNNDTEVAPDYFAALDEALRAAPEAALLSGTINEMEHRDRIWYAGGRLLPLRSLALHDREVPRDPEPRPTAFVTGCALVVSRAAFELLGPLPECYFPAYMEDAEYSWRARAAGLAVLYAPRPLVYHRGGASAGRATESPWPAFLNVRHRAFFARRNLRGARRAAALGYLLLTKPLRAMFELGRGRPAMASALVRGLVSGLWSPSARR